MNSMARSYLNFMVVKLPSGQLLFQILKIEMFQNTRILCTSFITERNFKNNSPYGTTKSSNLDNSRKVCIIYLFWMSLFVTGSLKTPKFTLGTCLEKKNTHTCLLTNTQIRIPNIAFNSRASTMTVHI